MRQHDFQAIMVYTAEMLYEAMFRILAAAAIVQGIMGGYAFVNVILGVSILYMWKSAKFRYEEVREGLV